MARRDLIPTYPRTPYKGRYARVHFRGKEYRFKDFGSEQSKRIFSVWADMVKARLDQDGEAAVVPSVSEAEEQYQEGVQQEKETQIREQVARELQTKIRVDVPPAQVINPDPIVLQIDPGKRSNFTSLLAMCCAISAVAMVVAISALLRPAPPASPQKIIIDSEDVADSLQKATLESLPNDDARRRVQAAFSQQQSENFARTAAQTRKERQQRVKALMNERKKSTEAVRVGHSDS